MEKEDYNQEEGRENYVESTQSKRFLPKGLGKKLLVLGTAVGVLSGCQTLLGSYQRSLLEGEVLGSKQVDSLIQNIESGENPRMLKKLNSWEAIKYGDKAVVAVNPHYRLHKENDGERITQDILDMARETKGSKGMINMFEIFKDNGANFGPFNKDTYKRDMVAIAKINPGYSLNCRLLDDDVFCNVFSSSGGVGGGTASNSNSGSGSGSGTGGGDHNGGDGSGSR